MPVPKALPSLLSLDRDDAYPPPWLNQVNPDLPRLRGVPDEAIRTSANGKFADSLSRELSRVSVAWRTPEMLSIGMEVAGMQVFGGGEFVSDLAILSDSQQSADLETWLYFAQCFSREHVAAVSAPVPFRAVLCDCA